MIKKITFLFLTVLSFNGFSQFSPIPSPSANSIQTVGITNLEIDYSRPRVKGRNIFGDLVPFNKVWRTGANACTKITFSNQVKINSSTIPAGTYSLLTIPNETEWTVIFNNDLEVTQDTYFSANDQLRVFAKPTKTDFVESFTIDFTEVKDNAATFNIYWANTKISLPIEVDNLETIKLATDYKAQETAAAFLQASEYLLNNNLDLVKAKELIEQSITLSPTFRNHWVYGRILLLEDNKTEALKNFKIAKKLGEEDSVYVLFKENIEENISALEK